MTSLEMLKEFKVGIDKIDSESYPEIYKDNYRERQGIG